MLPGVTRAGTALRTTGKGTQGARGVGSTGAGHEPGLGRQCHDLLTGL